jgi:hypothetical protein
MSQAPTAAVVAQEAAQVAADAAALAQAPSTPPPVTAPNPDLILGPVAQMKADRAAAVAALTAGK